VAEYAGYLRGFVRQDRVLARVLWERGRLVGPLGEVVCGLVDRDADL